MKPQTWQEELEKLLDSVSKVIAGRPLWFEVSPTFLENKLKPFISLELQRAREEAVEEAIKAVPEERNIVGKLEHLIKSGTSKSTRRKYTSIGHGFNECRHKTLTALNKLKSSLTK